MKVKPFLLVVALSFLVECLTGILRGYASFMVSSLVGYILYFFLTIYLIKKIQSVTHDVLILLALFLGLSIIEIPIRVLSWESTMVSLPDAIMHYSGIIIGYVFLKTKPNIGRGITIIGLVSVLFMFFSGYDLWLNKLNYGTFTGIVCENAPEFNLNCENLSLNNASLKNRMVVLDFWHTACGVCFQKFPEFQKRYDKYKNVKGLEFYAVNIHIKRDTLNQAINTIRKLKYTFPVIIVDDDSLLKKFKVTGVPVTIIINNGSHILYRGDVEGIDKIIEEFKN